MNPLVGQFWPTGLIFDTPALEKHSSSLISQATTVTKLHVNSSDAALTHHVPEKEPCVYKSKPGRNNNNNKKVWAF